MSALDAIKAQFQARSALPFPALQEIFDVASPIQLVVSIASAGFGSSVPVKLQARVFLTGLGQGLPQVPLSFAVDGKAITSNVFTDKNGQVVFSTNLSQPGTYKLQVFAGPVDPNNQAVKSVTLTVTKVSVTSPISVGFTAEGANFNTPTTLFFPYFSGGPSYYTLNFTPLVNLGKNNAWFLNGSSQITTDANGGDIFLPYVLPTPAIQGPSQVNADQAFSLTGTLMDQNNNPLQNLALTLNMDGNDVATAYTDGSGLAQFGNLTLPQGNHQAFVHWLGLNLSALLAILAIVPPPPAIAQIVLNVTYAKYTGGFTGKGPDRSYATAPPVVAANAPISISVYPINRNTRPPAYNQKLPVLLPDSVSGVTDSNGQFTFILLQNDPGLLMGYYAIGTVAACCQPLSYYDQYQITVTWQGQSATYTFSPPTSPQATPYVVNVNMQGP